MHRQLALGVDVQSTGRYVIWWPRERLEVIDAEVADWPAELLELARRELPTGGAWVTSSRDRGGTHAPPVSRDPLYEPTRSDWRLRLKGIRRTLQNAQEGNRNHCLYWAACRIAELVAEGHLKVSVAVRLLELDCRANGLWDNIGALRNDGPERCRATIVSAFNNVEEDLT
jgi:hypothetical protein